MNGLDLVIVILVGWGVIRGFFRGLISEISSILGVMLGFSAARSFYERLANNMYTWVANPDSAWVQHPEYSKVVAFLTIFIAVYFLVVLAGWAIKSIARVAMLGWVDRVFGVLFGLVKGSLIAMIIIFTMTVFMPVGKAEMVNKSQLAPYVNKVMEKTLWLVPLNMQEMFEKNIAEIEEKWAQRP